MDKYPTPTLDKIAELKKTGDWIAKGGESIDPTSLDERMFRFLLLGSLELIGSQLFEINKKLSAPKSPEPNPAMVPVTFPITPVVEPIPNVTTVPKQQKKSTKK